MQNKNMGKYPLCLLLWLASSCSLMTNAENAQVITPLEKRQIPADKNKPKRLLHPGDVGFGQLVKTVPKDFPLPIMPDALLYSINESKTPDSRKACRVRFATRNTADQALSWYKQAAGSDGWRIEKERNENLHSLNIITLDMTKSNLTGHVTVVPCGRTISGASVVISIVGM